MSKSSTLIGKSSPPKRNPTLLPAALKTAYGSFERSRQENPLITNRLSNTNRLTPHFSSKINIYSHVNPSVWAVYIVGRHKNVSSVRHRRRK
jgi:hypothetical protein